MMNWFVIQGS